VAQARDDERWKQAQADYIAEYPELDPDAAMWRRIAAAKRMHEIEREYDPTLTPTEELIARMERGEGPA
jgi:hypothetical protein